jgi:hypothetical protein
VVAALTERNSVAEVIKAAEHDNRLPLTPGRFRSYEPAF